MSTDKETKVQKQQTGFRAERELLNRFRSKLALEGKDMGPVLEDFIKHYLEPEAVEPVLPPEWDVVLTVLREGGEAAESLRQMAVTLHRLKGGEAFDESKPPARVVTDERIEEAQRLNEEALNAPRAGPKRTAKRKRMGS